MVSGTILLLRRVENPENLAMELGCKVGSLRTSYLGLPLGAGHNSLLAWDGFEERFPTRLVLWKRQFISNNHSFENVLKYAHLHHAVVSNSEDCKIEVGKNPKRPFIRRGCFGKENPQCHWKICVFR